MYTVYMYICSCIYVHTCIKVSFKHYQKNSFQCLKCIVKKKYIKNLKEEEASINKSSLWKRKVSVPLPKGILPLSPRQSTHLPCSAVTTSWVTAEPWLINVTDLSLVGGGDWPSPSQWRRGEEVLQGFDSGLPAEEDGPESFSDG